MRTGWAVLLCLTAALDVRVSQERVVPNDPLYPRQISFYHEGGTISFDRLSYRPSEREFRVAAGVTLEMPRAWALGRGSRDVVVALLDDGFFYRHEDIRSNVWRNPGELGVDTAGYPKDLNGVDDDGNGYTDDVVGWDFAFDDPDPDAYAFDGMDRSRVQPYWHSIPALGIIGAEGNNGIGVAGINWRVSMMLLRIGAQGIRRGERDTARVGRAAEAIRYAADNGARIINWSGYVNDTRPDRLELLREAIAYAGSKDVLLVVGAGNDGKDIDQDGNCRYPQCFDLDNILTVAEIDFDGKLFRYTTGGEIRGSNYGIGRVDVAAIAQNFTTAIRHGTSAYSVASGTSNAGPVAAGLGALVLSLRPELTALELKEILMATVTPIPELASTVRSGGALNAYRTLRAALER